MHFFKVTLDCLHLFYLSFCFVTKLWSFDLFNPPILAYVSSQSLQRPNTLSIQPFICYEHENEAKVKNKDFLHFFLKYYTKKQ